MQDLKLCWENEADIKDSLKVIHVKNLSNFINKI